ncbi:MAG: hypothetical protein ACI9C4_001459 [Paraglaciecola sp.]|jgi:hypothetical protein
MNTKIPFRPALLPALTLVVCSTVSFMTFAEPSIFTSSFSPTTIGPNGTSTLTYTIDNSTSSTGLSGLTFDNTLPAGMTIAPSVFAAVSDTCVNGYYTATPGANSITFNDYRLSAGESCSFQVNITSTTPGAAVNTTGALATSAGTVGTADATLTVDASRPGFSMAFSPATITPGIVSRLTYTIDNTANGSNAERLMFAHSLPAGLTISEQPSVSTTCAGGVMDVLPTSSTLSLTRGSVSNGASCTFSVKVTAKASGIYRTKTGDLSQNGANPSGPASAKLTVENTFLDMAFPNSSVPGSSVELTVTINNLDRVNAAENINFTSDLDATLSGLSATALPANGFCGAGSTLTGSSILTLAGASLASEASCSFTVTVLIPSGAAAGFYTHTTSTINVTLGSATTKVAAESGLLITNAPMLSTSFIDDPVSAGDNVTLRYVITNTDSNNAASGISFTQAINTRYAGMTINTLPSANSCGNGSVFNDIINDDARLIGVYGGNLAPGGSCTFDVSLTLPSEGSPGSFAFTTSAITATVSGDLVYGAPASDTLVVNSGAPQLTLAISEQQIAPGAVVTLDLSLAYSENASADISNLAFTLDLDSALSGLMAITSANDICGAGSSITGTSTLTFSGGMLAADSLCSFALQLQIPDGATPATITLISSAVTGTTNGAAVSSSAASDTLIVGGLTLTKSFSGIALAGDTISLTYTLTNSADALGATAIVFSDSLSQVIKGLSAVVVPSQPCGASSSMTGSTTLIFSGGELSPGASCSFDVSILVPGGASTGVYHSVTSGVSTTVNGNNTVSIGASGVLEIEALTVLLATTESNPTPSTLIPVDIYFSRGVVNFTIDDLAISNATVSNFSGSGDTYQVDLTPISNGEVTVQLPADMADDAVANGVQNPISNALSLVYNSNTGVALVLASSSNTLGSHYTISGTSDTNGASIYLYSDSNNNGVADTNTILATGFYDGVGWSLNAPLTLGNVNNFVLGWYDSTYQLTRFIDVPTINETTLFSPVISGSAAAFIAEDSVYTFAPTATDINAGDTLTFSIAGMPGWANFSTTTGVLTGTPGNAHVGVSSNIIITVADGAGGTDSLAAFTIRVNNTNDAPVIAGTPLATIAQGSSYSFTPSVLDVDADDTQIFSITGEPSWVSLSTSTGRLTGIPGNDDVGVTRNIIITVVDGAGSADRLAAFSITVNNINDAPTITLDTTLNTIEDNEQTLSFTFTDVDGDTVSATVSTQPDNGVASVTGTTVTYVPDVNFNGSDSFTLTFSDGAGYTSTQVINVIVSSVNDTPSITLGSALSTDEDNEQTLSFTFTDVDGDTVSATVSTEPDNGVASVTGTTVIYVPDVNFNGSDSFTLTLSDGGGYTSTQVINVVVSSVNDPPEAVTDSFKFDLNQSNTYILDVLSNDSDIDGDLLSIIGTSATTGTVTTDGASIILTTPVGFVGQVALTYSITDGNETFDSTTVEVLINGELSTTAPVITIPGMVEVNATGLYTRVNLGVATALNSSGKPLAVSLVGGQPVFRPGNHIAYWQATDAVTGLTTVASQQVIVHPLISLGKNQVVTEGKTASVGVMLNGEAPRYPVIVTITVSGSADDSDYNIDTQQVTIASGTQATLFVEIVQDNINEGDETLIVSLDGVNVGHVMTIVERNIAPQVTLSSSQNTELRQVVTPGDGVVTVQATVLDINDDNVSTQWSYDTLLNISEIDEHTILLDPSELSPGIYPVSLTVTDDGEGPLSTTQTLYLEILDSLLALTDIDSDGDLIPDSEEGYGDSDQDGIPDFLDAIGECNVMPEQVLTQNAFLVEGQPGACLRKGNTLAGGETGGVQLTASDIANSVGMDDQFVIVGGIFDYIVTGLPQAGQNYRIVFPQRQPIPVGAVYRKYNERFGWEAFAEDVNNQLHSAPGESGYCPPPADVQWSLGLTEGYWCVRLTIEDGGPNDNDGIANTTIVDPGGVSVAVTDNTIPVAQADIVRVKRNGTLVIDVLANDVDADGDRLSIGVATATFGDVSITADNQLYYQSKTDFIGLDTLVYTLSDGNGGSDSGTASITVYANEAPVALNDSANTDDRTKVIITVLDNDSDADGDSLTIISATVDEGSVSINDDGALTYTPDSGFSGIATISYTIDDGQGDQDTAQVTVYVAAYQTVTKNNKAKGGSTGLMIIVLATVVLFRVGCRRVSKKRLVQGAAAL